MQQTSPPPPAPPPATASPQAPATASQPATASPTTTQDWAALRARRSELSSQLRSAQNRRDRLVQSMKRAEGANRTGLEQRLVLLDDRILQLESDITEAGRQLASAPASVLVPPPPPRPRTGMDSSDISVIATVFTIFVLGPVAIAFARMLWKRATMPRAPRTSPELAQRLERLEHAVDTIAIEMERVSEGQRFLTRVLTEGNGLAALAAGQRAAEPVRVPEPEHIRMSRREG